MGIRSYRSNIDYKKLNENKRFCNTDVIQEVAEELDLPEDLVASIAAAQSGYTAQTIKAGGLETILFVYLGKFKVNPFQVQKMMANSMKT
jgi:hypothetical protein